MKRSRTGLIGPLGLVGILALLAGASYAHADSQQQLITASDGKDSVQLALNLNDNGDIKELVVDPRHPDPANRFSIGQLKGNVDVPISGHTGILFIQTPGFNPVTGGPVMIRWTKNMIFGGQGTIGLYLTRFHGGPWHLYYGQKPIRALHVTTALMGIDSISPVASILQLVLPAANGLNPSVVDIYGSERHDEFEDSAQASLVRHDHHLTAGLLNAL